MSRGAARAGISLIETLVVLSIVALLLAIVIPAIQRVRALMDRVACGHKMRALGVALHGHHVERRAFPPGCTYLGGAHPEPHLSWLARLLPYLGEQALWQETTRAFEKDKFFLNVPPHTAFSRQPAQFACPADPRLRGPQPIPSFSGGTMLMGFTSYLGVSGLDQTTRDGILHLDSKVRFADVGDGLSQTLVVGERPPSARLNAGWWYAGWGKNKTGAGEMILGVRELNTYPAEYPYGQGFGSGPFEFGPGKLTNQGDLFHFWSIHPGGANFLFADNSVRFLRWSARSVLPALATFRGGEAAVALE